MGFCWPSVRWKKLWWSFCIPGSSFQQDTRGGTDHVPASAVHQCQTIPLHQSQSIQGKPKRKGSSRLHLCSAQLSWRGKGRVSRRIPVCFGQMEWKPEWAHQTMVCLQKAIQTSVDFRQLLQMGIPVFQHGRNCTSWAGLPCPCWRSTWSGQWWHLCGTWGRLSSPQMLQRKCHPPFGCHCWKSRLHRQPQAACVCPGCGSYHLCTMHVAAQTKDTSSESCVHPSCGKWFLPRGLHPPSYRARSCHRLLGNLARKSTGCLCQFEHLIQKASQRQSPWK